MKRDELARYLDQLLDASRVRDYCPNGLQVEGREEVAAIVSGVTASVALIEAAAAAGADAQSTSTSPGRSRSSTCISRESGVAFVAAGHHATERFGVQALGEHLARTFGLRHRFIDIASPV